MKAYKDNAEMSIKVNKAKDWVVKNVIEPIEKEAGLVEIDGGADAGTQQVHAYDIIWIKPNGD